jgi:hypothetical protein
MSCGETPPIFKRQRGQPFLTMMMHQLILFIILLSTPVVTVIVGAFAYSSPFSHHAQSSLSLSSWGLARSHLVSSRHLIGSRTIKVAVSTVHFSNLFAMLKENDDDDSSLSSISSTTTTTTTIAMKRQREIPNLSPEDRMFVTSTFTKFNNNSKMMEAEIAKNIDTMSPSLLVALQMAGETREWKEKDGAAASDAASVIEFESQMVNVGQALRNVLTKRLEHGKELLEQMLTSGEIRKLDALIGKSAREGLLDTSFFQVLNANMMDASSSSTIMSTSNNKINDDSSTSANNNNSNSSNTIPDKLQILNHIQTRCHEELEKAVPPGTGLLNKLLRTTIPSIRDNQLRHYLGPRATSITSPDGKVIDLHLPKSGSNNGGEAGAAPLVSHVEFGTAISDAILRIRSIDTAGGTDKLVAQKLIEEVRQIAIEARRVLVSVNEGGEESTVVMEYSEMLGPVFRPKTTGVATSTAKE